MKFAIAANASAQAYACLDGVFRSNFLFATDEREQPDLYETVEDAYAGLSDYWRHRAACVVKVEPMGPDADTIRHLRFVGYTRRTDCKKED